MQRLLVRKFQLVHGLATQPTDVLESSKASWAREEWDKFQADMEARSRDAERVLREQVSGTR
jgi:hypothetical protein